MGRRRNKIDIVGALPLQLEKQVAQPFLAAGRSDDGGADLKVLAEYAPQVASAEKDGP